MRRHPAAKKKNVKVRGLRRTARRSRLLQFFDEGRAWTAAELHRRLASSDLSTVYRNLHRLADKGVIIEVALSGGEARFESAKRPHHAHLLCARCGRAECVPCPADIATEHRLELRGLCSACA